MKKTYKVNFALKSRRGLRAVNQDAVACSFNHNRDFCAIVCDGMGSIDGSEHASSFVANTFADEFEKLEKIDNPVAWFRQTLPTVLERLRKHSIALGMPKISTTIVLLIITGNKYYCFNIGDTRAYKIQKNLVKQVSYDHNYMNFLLLHGADEKTLRANEKHLFSLTSYINGSSPKSATWDVNDGVIDQKTIFLLCTDGVYKVMKSSDIYNSTWLKHGFPLALRSTMLNGKALNFKSNDNVSNIVVLVK